MLGSTISFNLIHPLTVKRHHALEASPKSSLHHGTIETDKPRGARTQPDPGGGLVESHVETRGSRVFPPMIRIHWTLRQQPTLRSQRTKTHLNEPNPILGPDMAL